MKRTNYFALLCILAMCLFGLTGCSQGISTKGMNVCAEQKTTTQTDSSNKDNEDKAVTPKGAQTQSVKKKTKRSSDDAQKAREKDVKSPAKKDSTKKKPSSSKKTDTTSSSPSPSKKPSSESKKITITVTVDCKTAVAKGYKEALALTSSGTLAHKTVTLNKGASVFDALKASGLSIGAETSAMGTYVYAISSLREKDCGSKSGWLYSINGAFVSDSCDSAKLHDGDSVRWRYTCDSGKDL